MKTMDGVSVEARVLIVVVQAAHKLLNSLEYGNREMMSCQLATNVSYSAVEAANIWLPSSDFCFSEPLSRPSPKSFTGILCTKFASLAARTLQKSARRTWPKSYSHNRAAFVLCRPRHENLGRPRPISEVTASESLVCWMH